MSRIAHLDLPPLTSVAGVVRLPGSKSISNRALLLAGLCEGTTSLPGLLVSDDTRVMLTALQALGCDVSDSHSDGVTSVTGLGGNLRTRQACLDLGNAGTAMRPLAAALALLAHRHGGDFTLRGNARMHERPIGDLVDALRGWGCAVDYLGNPGYPPLRVHGVAGGRLALMEPLRVRGDVSSQFLSAVLMCLPLASEDGRCRVEVDGELISRPYVELTLKLLQAFGVTVDTQGWQHFTVAPGSQLRSPGRFTVEGDASSASYFVAMGAIAATDKPLRIEGVGTASIQGDLQFIEAAAAMGAQVSASEHAIEVRRGAPGVGWPLRAIELDCNAIPDAAMTLAVMALYADGPCRLTNIASWRVKETDRIAAMTCELQRLGATVRSGDDFIEITPPVAWRAATCETYDDHRMAMCLSLAAFNALAGAAPPVPVRLLDPGCVAKTFPDYFPTLFSVASVATSDIPVITIDGPTASGKGTLAAAIAAALGFHLLDSGALYRVTALSALERGIALDDGAALAEMIPRLALRLDGDVLLLDGRDMSAEIRAERIGAGASQVSVWPAVRQALLDLQLGFRRLPGLVADGRDMGTVVFPDARLKVFLTASAATRAVRRHKQLISKGISANIDALRADLESRDERDKTRAASPLEPAQDALLLDNSALTVEESVAKVLGWWQQRGVFA